MEYEMLDDKVLIKMAGQGEMTTESGLVIPESMRPKNEGTVVAVGKGRFVATASGSAVKPMTVKPGDNVVFVPERCVDLEINGEKHVVTLESDILAIRK